MISKVRREGKGHQKGRGRINGKGTGFSVNI